MMTLEKYFYKKDKEMCNKYKNTIVVQVEKNQDNSKELFNQWNKENKLNVMCGKYKCNNNANNSAYIVKKLSSANKKFILPLCKECYEIENNSKQNSSSDIQDIGSALAVEENLLIEYNP